MKKMFTKENRIAILLSVIASVIFAQLVEPLMDILGTAGNRIIEIAVNYYYVRCADTTSTTFIHTMAYIIFIMGVTNVWVTFLPFAFGQSKENSIVEKENADIIQQKLENQVSISDLEDKISKLDKKIQRVEKDILRKQNREKIAARVMLVAIFCFFFLMVIFIYSPVIARNDFDKKIIQIAPYVDNVELVHLNADWVNMETRDDYSELKWKIESIMEANGINRR